MWIELPDDIEEYLCCINNPMCKSALAVNALLESMLKGQHIVYASRKLLNTIEHLDYINPSNKAFISWVKQQYVYVYGCKNIVEYRIVVTVFEDAVSVNDKMYMVPLNYFYDFRETKLLTENETDGDFFLKIYSFIKRDKKLGNIHSVKFENDSCHGANVASKIAQTAKDNRIGFCILDSDKEMKGAAFGSTYKGANNAFKKIKNNHIILLQSLDAREKENLFPPCLYIALCEEKAQFLSIIDKFIEDENIIKYFDIKDGIKYKTYNDSAWRSYYIKVVDMLMQEGLFLLPDEEEVAEEFMCVDGIGAVICDVISKVFLGSEELAEEVMCRRGIPNEKKEQIRTMRESLSCILPAYMYSEWEQIHKWLFSWGCCISEKKLPNYHL